ncbi:MAG: DnaB-like helicase N-terminal domain-containing protein, partial [Myxococcota bacterium]
MPHSIEAEASVLGGILLRNDVLTDLDQLDAEDFYDPRHQAVFAAMRRLEAEAKPIDEVTLGDELRKDGNLESIGGLSFLSQLALKVPTAANAMYYAEIVRDKHAARRLMVAASEIAAKGYGEYGEVQDFLANRPMKKYFVQTFGCQMNVHDSRRIEEV